MPHAPSVNVTAAGFVAATVGLASLAANPVPVPLSVAGSVPLVGVNDHNALAVNVDVVVTVATVKENGVPPGAAQIWIAHELRFPVPADAHVFAPVNTTSDGVEYVSTTPRLAELDAKPVPATPARV